MINQPVAKRYAKALFDIGTEQGKLKEFAASMANLKKTITENEQVSDVLTSHLVSVTEKKKVMRALLKEDDQVIANTVCVVLDKNRAGDLVAICDAYQYLMEQADNIQHALIKSAVPLTDEQVRKIEEKFAALTGNDVKASLEVDEALIGGVAVTIGDKVYDGSVACQLEKLKRALK